MTTHHTDVEMPGAVGAAMRIADADECGLLVCLAAEPTVVAANETLRDRLGVDEHEVVGDQLDAVQAAPSLDDWRAFVGDLDDEEWRSLTGRHRRADGSTYPVDIEALNVPVEEGEPYVLLRTEPRGKTATQEAALERQFEALFEHPASFVGLLDPDGTVRRVNRTALEFVDATPESVTGTPFWETPWWDHSTALQGDLRDHIDRAAAGEFQRFEADHVAPDGETVIVDTSLVPIENAADEVTGIAAIGRDITDHNERERQLARQKSQIEALHGVATDIGTAETVDAVFDRVVEAAEEILDFDIAIADRATGDVLVPKAVSSELDASDYFEETPIDAENNEAATVYRTGEPSIVDDIAAHKADPASAEFRSALTVPIGEFGMFQSVDSTVGAFDETDLELTETLTTHAATHLERLTTQQQLEERTRKLEQQNEKLEQFASVAAHDLRNPLNVAQGEIELARLEFESDHLEEAVTALDRSLALIDDLLTLAREGKRASDVGVVSLTELVRRCWGNVETDEATLVVETDQSIRADASRLKQLLENLIRNSVEHGSTGSPNPSDSGDTVEHGSTGSPNPSDSGDSIEHGSTNDGEADDVGLTITVGDLPDGFYVADDGRGIPEAERDQVFEAGYSTAATGTGFGLNIVREVAEAHGWKVTVTESESGGARFEVTGVESA